MRVSFAFAMLCLARAAIASEADDGASAALGTLPSEQEAREDDALLRPKAYSLNPAPAKSPGESAATQGQPENRWRYRYFRGRWWYWTPHEHWAYFSGSRWETYRPAGSFLSRKVDPALLRLEAKEGALGYKRWQHSGGGAGMSGTRGSVGSGGAQGGGSMGGAGGIGGGGAGSTASGGAGSTAGGGSGAAGGGNGAAGGGAGFGISGTRGSMGGAASGSWTVSPGTPNSINTTAPRTGAPAAQAGGARIGR